MHLDRREVKKTAPRHHGARCIPSHADRRRAPGKRRSSRAREKARNHRRTFCRRLATKNASRRRFRPRLRNSPAGARDNRQMFCWRPKHSADDSSFGLLEGTPEKLAARSSQPERKHSGGWRPKMSSDDSFGLLQGTPATIFERPV